MSEKKFLNVNIDEANMRTWEASSEKVEYRDGAWTLLPVFRYFAKTKTDVPRLQQAHQGLISRKIVWHDIHTIVGGDEVTT